MKKLIIPFILILISSSCNQDEEIRPEWPFEFIVVNNGDSEISRISLYTQLTYPEESLSSILTTSNNIWSNDEAQLLTEFDSISLNPEYNVYKGCNFFFLIRVAIPKDLNGDGQLEELSKTLVLQDTIKTLQDSSTTVIWPRDSALFSTE